MNREQNTGILMRVAAWMAKEGETTISYEKLKELVEVSENHLTNICKSCGKPCSWSANFCRFCYLNKEECR